MKETAINWPTPVYDPSKGLLHNRHFQLAYVTNDIDQAVDVFRQRFGVECFRAKDNDLPDGGCVGVRSVWIGGVMVEICHGRGPSMTLYTDWAPPEGEFVLRFHHFGYLVGSGADWGVLERQVEEGGWKVRSNSDTPGFCRAMYVEAPELGHFLEFVLPREGLIERINATPVA